MSIRRITISVPERVAARIKKAAGEAPVSAWVTDVIEERLEADELERRFEQFHADVSPSREEARRAESIFKRLTKKPRRRRAA